MKVRKLSAILLAGALMATPVVTSTAMAESSQTESTQDIVDESGNLVIKGTRVTGVTEQGKNAKEIKIPEGVTSIAMFAFYECKNLTSVTISKSVTTIESGAFSRCENLTNITIPESLTNIDNSAFYNTPWFENKKKENPLVIINNILIDGTSCTGDVVIPDGVTSIRGAAFVDCTNLKSVSIPNSVITIEGAAFENCSNLKSITIPDSVTKVGSNAFYGCENLENAIIGNGVVSLGMADPSANPDVIFSLFGKCRNLKTVTIGDNVKDFAWGNAFSWCPSLESINVSEKNKYFSSSNGILFDKDKTKLMVYPANKTETSYTIPKTVTEIDFVYGKNLNSVYIHKNVTDIAVWFAFTDCTNLKDVYYEGTEEQLLEIIAASDLNEIFDDDAVIHYNSTMPEETPDTPSSSTPKSKDFSDSTTNVTVSVPQELVEETLNGVTLAVEQVENKTDDTKVTYEISFKEADGTEVQPNGKVTVKIPVPAVFNGKDIYVFRFEADGTYTNMNATIEGDTIVFETDHFSEYVVTTDGTLADKATDSSDSEPSDNDTDTSSDPETSDSTDNSPTSSDSDSKTSSDNNTSNSGADKENADTGFGGIAMTLGVVALAGAAIVVAKKKH